MFDKLGLSVNGSYNLVSIDAEFHLKLHTNFYYAMLNIVLFAAYAMGNGNIELQKDYVLAQLANIRAAILAANEIYVASKGG